MELNILARESTGKKAKNTRPEGKIPGVVFGKKIGSISVWVDIKDLSIVRTEMGENSIINLNIDGDSGRKIPALVQNIQIDPLSRFPLHVDLQAIDLTEKITVDVPVEVVGESQAVVLGQGLLLVLHDHIEIECLPGDIPAKIEVDISNLQEVGDSISVKQLSLDTNKLGISLDEDDVLVKIDEASMAEEEVEVADASAAVEENSEGAGSSNDEGDQKD